MRTAFGFTSKNIPSFFGINPYNLTLLIADEIPKESAESKN